LPKHCNFEKNATITIAGSKNSATKSTSPPQNAIAEKALMAKQLLIIFYRVINKDIEIMRVIRGDRNLEAMFEEKL
jgi:plasmid stabilization system protein ParE